MIEIRNGNAYAYRSFRVGKRVKRAYMGAGEVGRLMDDLYQLQKLSDQREAAQRKALADRVAARLAEDDRTAREALECVLGLVGAVLTRSGFHRPSRHEWRRKRGRPLTNINDELKNMTLEQAMAENKAKEWMKDRIERGYAGDKQAEKDLFGDEQAEHDDEFTDEDMPPPPAHRKKRYATSLPSASRINMLNTVTNNDESFDVITREIKKVETDLAGENPSPIVKLLASAAAAAYLDMWITDSHGKKHLDNPSESQERYRNRAHRRYLSTLKALATVRRLESQHPTTITVVGTGPQQVNVAGPADPRANANSVPTGPEPKPIGNG